MAKVLRVGTEQWNGQCVVRCLARKAAPRSCEVGKVFPEGRSQLQVGVPFVLSERREMLQEVERLDGFQPLAFFFFKFSSNGARPQVATALR